MCSTGDILDILCLRDIMCEEGGREGETYSPVFKETENGADVNRTSAECVQFFLLILRREPEWVLIRRRLKSISTFFFDDLKKAPGVKPVSFA